ncbi:hypothetical protein SI855_002750 [Clostridioides difficile]|nr:hypothetical protein [Clostridioides difficile]
MFLKEIINNVNFLKGNAEATISSNVLEFIISVLFIIVVISLLLRLISFIISIFKIAFYFINKNVKILIKKIKANNFNNIGLNKESSNVIYFNNYKK